MIHIEFTEEEKQALHYERFHHPHPRVQLKMEAIWLKSQKLPHSSICKLTGISPNTLRSYLRDYQEGGIEKLKEINFYQPKSEMESHRQTLKAYFQQNPPASINEAISKIESLTGIKRSPTQVRKFLKSMGMRCLKVGFIPSKADPDEQQEYKLQKLEPRLTEAKAGERAVFFVDAAHFVMGAFLSLIWCFERILIKSPSGRKRFNVLAALNAITHEVITVTNDTYITATQICELLHKLADLGLTIPITLVLDNARYQKCKVVQNLADSLKIELLYLPPYSPNLNLIERLWKFVRKKCLYAKYYQDFSQFSTAISDCLNEAHLKHNQELDSLLTLRFQTFNKAQIMTV
ncbi:IS630 family transposase [Iningainema tapete]|uniref:IS630 family transposase n=1 Tax=Iningainema tapete BLCC-T55 TaxID=2748662 RepID=A0A8J7CGN3_9CYAN|nr:IS630 family transposase [Iningainema tapete]MBD2776595.1 IS630 family transposase [Iningainema tapete BLCC-T55]